MGAPTMSLEHNAGQLILILSGHVRRAVVSVLPQSPQVLPWLLIPGRGLFDPVLQGRA